MRLRWTPEAVDDLIAIRSYIGKDNLDIAITVVTRIRQQAESITINPEKGRKGRIPGTRESILPRLPYIIVYKLNPEEIKVLRILHTSRLWPGQI